MKQIDRSGLFFRKSKNRRGGECFVAKIKEGGENLIVIANRETCGITQKGRYDVSLAPLRSGKGYFVTSASFCRDTVELEVDWDNYEVRILINGVENKLKKTIDGKEKYIQLVFSCENYYPIDKIIGNIRDKVPYLQLGAETDMEFIIKQFWETSKHMNDEYMRHRNDMRFGKPNTPMADLLKDFKPQ